ncbi:MAG: competence/damage-inducible protein A [bacterium]
MFNIALISIGDEICIGQIINTNAAWISSKCTELGANVSYHSTIRDNKEDLINELNRSLQKSDMVIITGGLGPTHDDITKNVLTGYFEDELIFHEPTLEYLEKIFKLRGYNLTERNKEQALIPSKAKPLTNALGTAPGILFDENGKLTVALPGVPAEMKYIMNNSVLPIMQNKIIERNDDILLYKNYHTSGIPESMLADLIGDTQELLNGASLAFLPSYKGIKLRVGVNAKNFEEANNKIIQIEKKLYEAAGKFIYGKDDDSLSLKAGQGLSQLKMTVSVAESCTGGLLGGELTSISGSSEYFIGGVIVYSNEAKIKILDVDAKIIENYGAVSEEVVKELARNVRKKFGTDFGIGITGIAGPTGGTEEKPVGTVWIGIADENVTIAQKFIFGNDREINRERAVGTALNMLLKRIRDFMD